jgi:protein SCO1/2
MLVFFGYSNCPDICPIGLTTMAAALDALGARAAQVQPLFITVDPARDTEVLADYVAHFHPRLIGLGGSQAQVAAARAYRVHRSKVITSSSASAGDYLVTHSSLTFLMGPDGAFLTLFPQGTTAPAMVTAIAKYLR